MCELMGAKAKYVLKHDILLGVFTQRLKHWHSSFVYECQPLYRGFYSTFFQFCSEGVVGVGKNVPKRDEKNYNPEKGKISCKCEK